MQNQEARTTCEPCSTAKHILWLISTLASLCENIDRNEEKSM